MKRKIIIGSILAAFLLMTISIVSVVGTTINNEKKESPLYRIRTKRAITEKIENICANFLQGNRLLLISPLNIFLSANEIYGPTITCFWACKA
jgi:uncharacterized membrane protein